MHLNFVICNKGMRVAGGKVSVHGFRVTRHSISADIQLLTSKGEKKKRMMKRN